MSEKSKHPYLTWSIIISAAFIFFLTGISHESLWCDEAFSAKMAEYNFFDILKNTAADVHPPLYYLILKMFTLVFGNSEWALRLISVLGATGMIALGAGPVRKLFGDRTAYIYAAVTLFTPVVLIMAHEARMYSLTMFTVTASALYGLLLLKEAKTSSWIIFGVSVLSSAYLHYYSLIAVFIINLLLFILIILKKRELLKIYIITAGIIVLIYTPWFLFFLDQVKKVDNAFWISPLQPMTILLSLLQPFSYKNLNPRDVVTDILAPVVLLLVLTVITVSIISMIRKRDKYKPGIILFFFSAYSGTLLIAVIISLFLAPILYQRYMTVCTGFLILTFSIAAGDFRQTIIKISVVTLFLLLNLTAVINIQIRRFNGPFYEIANKFAPLIKPGALIISTDCFCISPVLYYFPRADHYFYVNSFEKNWQFIYDALRPNFIETQNTDNLFEKYKSFWFIKSNSGISSNVEEILKETEGWEEVVKQEDFIYPYSEIGFSLSEYAWTGKKDINKGKLMLTITGINNKPGTIL